MPPSSKYILRELSHVRLCSVLLISFSYFIVQMVVAHMAHSLILQVNAYHMLYNILALLTSVVTSIMCKRGSNLKTTFGWARMDVCGAVASLCFLAATCFSVVVEALQAMLHASHHETMKMPILVLIVGVIGILVNFVALIIIGGHTNHQKSFLGSHREGHDIVISPKARRVPKNSQLKFGGFLETLRDFSGSVLVVTVSIVLYYWGQDAEIGYLTFIDPCCTILEVCLLAFLSLQYAKDAGYILLLTIPDNINVELLLDELFESFPEIFDIHEFHVYQLNFSRVIATAHVVLKDTQNCWVVQNNIIEFLESKGITQVTLQPEFLELQGIAHNASPETIKRKQCFLPCADSEECQEKKCCLTDEEMSKLLEKMSANHGHSHGGGAYHNHSHGSKSLQNVNDSKLFDKPSEKIKSGKRSNPDLSIEKESIAVKPNVMPNTIEVKLKSATAVVKVHIHDDCEDEDTEDEEQAVLKPMI